MKTDIHPDYYPQAEVTCACGNTFTTGSTSPSVRVELCSQCHPFYTGEQRIVDTEGRVERLIRRFRLNEPEPDSAGEEAASDEDAPDEAQQPAASLKPEPDSAGEDAASEEDAPEEPDQPAASAEPEPDSAGDDAAPEEEDAPDETDRPAASPEPEPESAGDDAASEEDAPEESEE